MKPRTVAIIQARMASSRLPDKVVLEIAGRPMLCWVVERTRFAQTIDEVVVATTTDPADNAIFELCQADGYACSRGDMYDVLDRYYQAARQYQAEIIVRITADCPLIDPGLIDELVTAFIGNGDYPYDFAANRLPPPWKRSYPIGLDLEACSFQALETAWQEASQVHQREHVMPFFYDQPERFRLLVLNYPHDYGTLRWTVDTQQDLELVRQVIARFNGRDDFSWLEVLDLFELEPELSAINATVPPKHYQDTDHRVQR